MFAYFDRIAVTNLKWDGLYLVSVNYAISPLVESKWAGLCMEVILPLRPCGIMGEWAISG